MDIPPEASEALQRAFGEGIWAMTAEGAETPPEEAKLTPEEAIANLNQALEDYYTAAGWNEGLITDSVIVSAQQIFTESGHSRTQAYVLPLGPIPPYRIVGLLAYAQAFYNAEVLVSHMPPPMLVQQFFKSEDDLGEDET